VAQTAAPNSPTYLLFTGTDLWRYGDFLYGGGVWAPGGLDSSGFAAKLLLDGGAYNYQSGSLQSEVRGTMFSAAAMPGWRWVRSNLTVSVFAGPVFQDYRLRPDDPGSHLRGAYGGAQFGAEIWYQPSANTMASLNGTVASIGPTGSLRGAAGVRVFNAVFIGPEAAMLWCDNFEQVQLGLHLTGLRFKALEWSGGGGWSSDTDHRSGPYLRVGVSTKF
jgi:hypothetical protein